MSPATEQAVDRAEYMSSLNAQFSVSYQPVAKATSKKVRGSRWLPRPVPIR